MSLTNTNLPQNGNVPTSAMRRRTLFHIVLIRPKYVSPNSDFCLFERFLVFKVVFFLTVVSTLTRSDYEQKILIFVNVYTYILLCVF